ncbi:cellulose-binding domain-containing protein, partial [Streptomyces tricolor]|uniref:cellulose-binding domain-containing protein n=1 Tax=Streptomyces tricolor TaxID=68277 RepID=UPI001ABFB971
SRPAGCRVAYALDSQWPDGFQATVTVTTEAALSGWRVSWTFRDGQRVGQTWDATVHQDGSRVTATAADYNKTVAAHGSLSFGFLGTWTDANRTPHAFTLNGAPCTLG